MIDYSKWPRRKLTVTSLKLDNLNARLPDAKGSRAPTQPQIISYLVDHEDVYELAKKIAIQGYLLNEEPIVCKEDDKFVVLEGNRRVTACKILLNPNLLASASKRSNIKELLKGFNLDLIKKLEVRIAPSRTSADVIIVNRHTDGNVVAKWDKTKQDRFFYNRIAAGETMEDLSRKFNMSRTDLKSTLTRYHVYEELTQLDLSGEDRKKILDETKFNMTNVERFYASKVGREFLGIETDAAGQLIHHLPKSEYTIRLKKIALDVVQEHLTSRTFGNDKQKEEYMKRLRDSKEFNFAIKPSKKNQSEYDKYRITGVVEEEEILTKTKSARRGAASNRLVPPDVKWYTKNERIDRIFREMKSINIDTHFNSVAILFRSYLDMVVYQYLQKNNGIKDILSLEQQRLDEEVKSGCHRLRTYIRTFGVADARILDRDLRKTLKYRGAVSPDWVPSLKHMLVHLSQSELLLKDNKLRQALSGYVKGNIEYLSHNDFNLLVHNEYYIRTPRDLKAAWDQMQPILQYINQQLAR